MDRRAFLHRAALTAGAAFLGPRARARAPDGDGWRRFEVTTTVEVRRPSGRTRVWIPTPLVDTPYQRTSGDTYRADAGFVEMLERPDESLDMLVAEWPEGASPLLTVTSRVATRDHAVEIASPSVPPPLDRTPLDRYLRGTRSIPVHGLVKTTADAAAKGAGTDSERAHAIYDWVVDRTSVEPSVRGCGSGDVRAMLESGDLAGKAADINGLFVGLARAAGIPARVVYGLRIAASRLGPGGLGLSSDDATRGQHCRAEVYLTGFGWVPADPADVRQTMHETPAGNPALAAAAARAARNRLYGSWEMNWIAFNYAHDVTLVGAKRGPIGYFMYPQAETANARIDSLEPEAFRYGITVREA